jgi:hypothetical protein
MLYRALFLAALLLGSHPALAGVRAMVSATDPAGERVTLGRGEVFYVRIAYEADAPARLWVRPYFRGKEVAAHTNPSGSHTGSGHALGWFSLQDAQDVDEVRILTSAPSGPGVETLARHAVSVTGTGLAPQAGRSPSPWVAELRREAEAGARLEQERIRQEPLGLVDKLLIGALVLVVVGTLVGAPLYLASSLRQSRTLDSPEDRRRYRVAHAASLIGGLAVCLAISAFTGRKEAWDSPLYFSVGIPVMSLLIFAVSYLVPRRAWRWTASMAIGQSIALLAAGNSLSLWPLGIAAMVVLSLPQWASGWVASTLSRRMQGST